MRRSRSVCSKINLVASEASRSLSPPDASAILAAESRKLNLAILSVRSEKRGILSRDLLDSVRRPHPNQRVWGPQTRNQLRKNFWAVSDKRCYIVGAAYGAPVTSFKQSENILSRH